MYLDLAHIPFEERVPFSVDFADDVSQLFGIKYIGAEASGIVDIAATGDITFKHGDLSSEAADDDTKLDAGGLGIIDVSADVTDYHSLIRKINSSDNWYAWPIGCLPDADMHTTTVGHFTEVTGGSCLGDGYVVKTDDSDSLYVGAGMTFGGPPGGVHRTDHGVIHVLTRVVAKSTYASGTSLLRAYLCDDDAGTKTLLKTFTTGATTVEVAYPAETTPTTEPHGWAKGKRLVVHLINSVAMSVVRLRVDGWSYRFTIGRNARNWPSMDQIG